MAFRKTKTLKNKVEGDFFRIAELYISRIAPESSFVNIAMYKDQSAFQDDKKEYIKLIRVGLQDLVTMQELKNTGIMQLLYNKIKSDPDSFFNDAEDIIK